MFGLLTKNKKKQEEEKKQEEVVFYPNLKKNQDFPKTQKTKYKPVVKPQEKEIPYKKANNIVPKSDLKELEISPNITFKGEIGDCDKLIVKGDVETSIDLQEIVVEEEGSFEGTIKAKRAVIRGRFEGEIISEDKIIVEPTGSVKGKVFYSALEVKKGGKLSACVENL